MNNKSKIISGIITAAIAILIAVLLVSWKLNVNLHKGQQWPPVKEFELIAEDIEDPEAFVSTYSSAADDVWEMESEMDDPGASDIDSDIDTQTSYDLNNNGDTEGHHANLTATGNPSDLQQKNVNEGVAKTNDAERLEAERQQRSVKNIEKQVKFNRNSGAGQGEGGKESPKADGTKNNNGPGGNEPLTYSASVDQRPRSTELGTIRISVIVLDGGKVQPGSAQYHSGKDKAATNKKTIEACIKAAEKCNFRRASNDTGPRTGIVTFKWE